MSFLFIASFLYLLALDLLNDFRKIFANSKIDFFNMGK